MLSIKGPSPFLVGLASSLQVLGTASYFVLPAPCSSPCLTWQTYSGFSFLNYGMASSALAVKLPASPSGPLYMPLLPHALSPHPPLPFSSLPRLVCTFLT